MLAEAAAKVVDHSEVVLVYAQSVYFNKINCVKELFRAVSRRKKILLMLPEYLLKPARRRKAYFPRTDFYVAEFVRYGDPSEPKPTAVVTLKGYNWDSDDPVDPLKAKYRTGWEFTGEPSEGRNKLEFRAAPRNSAEYNILDVKVLCETFLPLYPFSLTTAHTLPTRIQQDIKLLLAHRKN